jgi:hypothetical protein
MTGPENFLSRWARLKGKSAAHRNIEQSGNVRSLASLETTAVRTGAERQARSDEPACESFDPESLPPIEAIGVDTDISAFLRSSVPAELTRAALRRAWVSDPGIRDFIGIAENQWDFTDPAAIPGFGPMRETDDLPALLAQAGGRLAKNSGRISEEFASPAQLAPADTVLLRDEAEVNTRQNVEVLLEDLPGSTTSDLANLKGTAAPPNGGRAADLYEALPKRRHGSALPR